MSEPVQSTADRLTTFIANNYSNADTSPGSVISELVVKLAASLQNAQYNTIVGISQSSAISQALGSSKDTYSSQIDLIASNYNTSRSEGRHSTGNIQVRVSSQNTYNIGATLQLIQPALGLTYKVNKLYLKLVNAALPVCLLTEPFTTALIRALIILNWPYQSVL